MGKIKVLIVDDDEITCIALSKEIEREGYDVRCAATGREAIESAKQEKPHIAYVDLIMPDINGVEICRKLKGISPEMEVVLISGHPEQIRKHRIDFVEAGGRDEILRKPLRCDELAELTDRIAIGITGRG